MHSNSLVWNMISWTFCLAIFALGILNLVQVHPVPGVIYILLSLLFFPPVNGLLKSSAGFSIPNAVKIILFILILWFTLGISDLAEMYGL